MKSDDRYGDAMSKQNVNQEVVDDFGKEWATFNQSVLKDDDLLNAFNQYFCIFPFDKINCTSVGFDMGCGSGRWAKFIAPRVGKLICVDPSSLALEQARENLKIYNNVEYECSAVSECNIADGTQDFGYSLGVLHHIPNTLEGLKSCSSKLKNGAPFLLYLYYRFDNKPFWYKALWNATDFLRRSICVLPFTIKLPITQLVAVMIYLPLSRMSLLMENFGFNVENYPLSDYRNKPFYFMKTDALDRFGTKLEKRFTKLEIEQMLSESGFTNITFSSRTPYWVAIAYKK